MLLLATVSLHLNNWHTCLSPLVSYILPFTEVNTLRAYYGLHAVCQTCLPLVSLYNLRAPKLVKGQGRRHKTKQRCRQVNGNKCMRQRCYKNAPRHNLGLLLLPNCATIADVPIFIIRHILQMASHREKKLLHYGAFI